MTRKSVTILVVCLLALVALFAVCDYAFDDESEVNDIGLVLHDRGDDDEEEEPKRGCAAFVIIACGDLIIPPGGEPS